MNANKKTPNPKNNSPWLLCPSKSFPGKFYYFNGLTGETAWCLSDTDKKLKKGTIHRVTDKTHSYPEPFEPPIDDSTNTTNSFTSLKNAGNPIFTQNANERSSPIFGRAVFPKYVSPEVFSPKFVWALTPMFLPSQVSHRQMVDEITQTYNQPIFVPHTSNHFQPVNSFTPSFQFKNQPFEVKDRQIFGQTAKHKSFKMSKEVQTFTKPCMKDEACQTFVPTRTKRHRSQSESDATPKSSLKECRSVENLTTLFTKDVETSTLSPSDKVDNETGKLCELDKNDLRFKLVAKKRKVESTVEAEKIEKSTDQSTSNTREALTPKKRVTFDIQASETSPASSDDVQETDQAQSPESRTEPSRPTDGPWYVVADTAAILADWQCLEDFVKTDERCRLLVPYAVHTELEARSRGDVGTVPARQALRKLAARASHIVVQSKPEYELPSEDSILQCCWDLLQEHWHVVLITNNTNMVNKAKSINLECSTLDEIKNNQTAAESQNDYNLKVIVKNNIKQSENLFLQDLSEVTGLCLPKPRGFSVSGSRINILNPEPGSDSETDINSDKLINLTRPSNKVSAVINSEVTNVKDQITNLCIAETIAVNNRTKQIIRNVFRTTDLDNKIDQDMLTVNIENSNSNHNIIDKHSNNNQNVTKQIDVIDEIDRDIRRLKVKENSIDQYRDTIKVSGITKLNNQFNLDVELERFHVKNAIVENRVKSRLDEWACRLNQIMEGVLTEILLKEKAKMKRMMPPWNLFEAIQVTGEAFKKQPYIKSIIDRFSMNLLNCSSKNGKLNKNIKPNDFMKLVGLSMILIDHLKEIANCQELFEADDMLVDLVKNIEDPKSDIDLTLEKVNTPIFSRSEMSVFKEPAGFRKSRSEIVEYLKKNFAAWQSNDTDNLTENSKQKTIIKESETVSDNNMLNKEPNVVRTCGKDLNTLKINNTKAITVNNDAERPDAKNQPKVIRNVKIIAAFEERLRKKAEFDLDQLNYEENETVHSASEDNEVVSLTNELLDDLSVSASSVDNDSQVEKGANSDLDQLNCGGNETMHNVPSGDNQVDLTNELLDDLSLSASSINGTQVKKVAASDLDQLNYDDNETVYTVSSGDDEVVNLSGENDAMIYLPDDILDDLSVSVSSVNSQCAREYPLAKIFLVKLKITLLRIFEFVNTSVQEYQNAISVDKKADILLKTELSRQYVMKISDRLKNIIARESSERKTLKDLLIKAGDYVEDDRVLSNYKQTVAKYLEQTQILEEVLDHMLCLSNAVSVKEKEEPYSDSRSTSPILPTRSLRNNT